MPTGFQQAPFFQVQTPAFALLAVDTGVLRTVDPEELTVAARPRSTRRAAKTMMAILGHPFFAGGHDTSIGDEGFTLSAICCASTTCASSWRATRTISSTTPNARPTARTVHHWVNGGGGAYLSFGAPLAWPASRRDATTGRSTRAGARWSEKIETLTPWWKWPAWWWTREFNAWPSSAEWLSAMFDYNSAPFFQSFVVVTVDPAAQTRHDPAVGHPRPAVVERSRPVSRRPAGRRNA